MKAHSAAVCQCNSRTPPAVRRMSTPASDFETANSRTVYFARPPAFVQAFVREGERILERLHAAGVGREWVVGVRVGGVDRGIGGAGVARTPVAFSLVRGFLLMRRQIL